MDDALRVCGAHSCRLIGAHSYRLTIKIPDGLKLPMQSLAEVQVDAKLGTLAGYRVMLTCRPIVVTCIQETTHLHSNSGPSHVPYSDANLQALAALLLESSGFMPLGSVTEIKVNDSLLTDSLVNEI